MNHFLVTRHEIITKQLIIRYVPDNQRLAIILPEADRIITFDVPWADDAFFDTIGHIGSELLAWGENDPIRQVYAYENNSRTRIVVQINDRMWQFEKRIAKGDTQPT